MLLVSILASILVTCIPGRVQADVCDEPNDTRESACLLSSGSRVTGFISGPNDVDVYRFEVTLLETKAVIELTDLAQDYDLLLSNARGDVVGQSLREGTSPERLELTMGPGAYYIYVKIDPAHFIDGNASYVLHLNLSRSPAGGGDGSTPTVSAIDDSGRVLVDDSLKNTPLLPRIACPTGLAGAEFVEDGWQLKIRGKCSAESNDIGMMAAFRCLTLRDAEVHLDVRFPTNPESTELLLFFRDGGQGKNGYFAGFGRKLTAIFSRINGDYKRISPFVDLVPNLWKLSDWNHISLRLIDSRISLLIDNQEVLSVRDSSAAEGALLAYLVPWPLDSGLEVAVTFRNLRVLRIDGGDPARYPIYPDNSSPGCS